MRFNSLVNFDNILYVNNEKRKKAIVEIKGPDISATLINELMMIYKNYRFYFISLYLGLFNFKQSLDKLENNVLC